MFFCSSKEIVFSFLSSTSHSCFFLFFFFFFFLFSECELIFLDGDEVGVLMSNKVLFLKYIKENYFLIFGKILRKKIKYNKKFTYF